MITFPLISRIIGPDNFGIIQYCSAFVVYFNLFISYGFNLTATRRIAKDPNNASLMNQVFSEVFYSQVLLAFISFVILTFLLYAIPGLKSNFNVAVFSFLFLFSTLFTQNWVFQAKQNLSRVAILNVLGKVIYFILVISLVTTKERFYWQPLSLTITQVFISVISFVWVVKIYKIVLIPVKLKRCLTLLWSEKFVFLSQTFSSMYITLNVILLGFLVSSEDIGYYTASQKLVLICVQLITMPLAQVLFPIVSKTFAKSKFLGVNQVQKTIPIVLTTSFLFCTALFLLSDRVLVWFYGDSFRNSILIFKILAFVPLLSSLNSTIGIQLLLNLGLDSFYFNVMAFITFFSLLLNVILTNYFGVEGTAISWVITEVVLLCIFILFSIKRKIRLFQLSFFSPREIFGSIRTVFK